MSNVKTGDVAFVTETSFGTITNGCDVYPLPVALAGLVVIVGRLDVKGSIKACRVMWRVEAARQRVQTEFGLVSFDLDLIADRILRRIPPHHDADIRGVAEAKPTGERTA